MLYVIIAFGIFGTILMMTKERTYEFGVLVAIGMKRSALSIIVWLEIFFIGLLGSIAGMIVSFPPGILFISQSIRSDHHGGGCGKNLRKVWNGARFASFFGSGFFFSQALIVFIITAVLAIYPFGRFTVYNQLLPCAANLFQDLN